MTFNFLNDGEQFNWVRIRPSDGALVLGLDDTKRLSDQGFLRVFFFDRPGNAVKDVVKNEVFPLEGNYSWEYLPDGLTAYLMLKGGKLRFSNNVGTYLKEMFLAMDVFFPSFPAANTAIFYCGNFKVVVDQNGGVQVHIRPGVEIKAEVGLKRGWNNLVFMSRGSDYGFVAALYINGRQGGKVEVPNPAIHILMREETAVLEGDFGIRDFYLAGSTSFAEREGLPGTAGSWVSKIISLPEPKQVFAISADAQVGPNDSAKVIVETDDSGSFLLSRRTEVALMDGAYVYPVQAVWGRHLRVSLELASSTGTVAVRSLSLRLAPYPTLLPVLSPPSLGEGQFLEVNAKPDEILQDNATIRLTQPPLMAVRQDAPDPATETPILWSQPFDGALLIGFSGGEALALPTPCIVEISGSIRMERDEEPLAVDASSPFVLAIDGKTFAYTPPQGYQPGPEPNWTWLGAWRGEPGWKSFVLRWRVPSAGAKLALGKAKDGTIRPVTASDLSGVPHVLAMRKDTLRINPPKTVVFEGFDLLIQKEGKAARYYVEVGGGAWYPGGGTARTFHSPYLVNPRLRFLAKVPLGARVRGMASDGVRLFVVDSKGLLWCFRGAEPVWANFVGQLTGPLTCPEDTLYVPTLGGLRVVETERGGIRATVRRPNAYPTSVLPFRGRLYIGWSDHSVSVMSKRLVHLGSHELGGPNPSHVDVPHLDCPYGRAIHMDVPHADAPHVDSYHEYHTNTTILITKTIHLDVTHSDEVSPSIFRIEDKNPPEQVHTNTTWGSSHGDSPHGNTAHQDVPHADQLHADSPPHADKALTLEELDRIEWGRGTNPIERGLNHEILIFRPTWVAVLSESLQTIFATPPRTGTITCAVLTDEVMPYPWSRLVLMGEETGWLAAFSLLDGQPLFEKRLEGRVAWIMPIPEGILVGHGNRVSLVSPLDGQVVASVELQSGDVLPCPARDRNGNLFVPTQWGVTVLDGALNVLDHVGFEEEVSAFLIWKDGHFAVAAGETLYLFSGASSRPTVIARWFPEQPLEDEPVLFWAEVEDFGKRIARVTWDFGFARLNGNCVQVRFPFAGEHVLYLEAVNDEGQGTLVRRVVRVRRSTQPWCRRKVVSRLPELVWFVKPKEGEVLAVPQVFSEIYRDGYYVLRLDLRGEGADLTGKTVRLLLKREESERAPAVLNEPFTVIDAANGLAEVALGPEKLKGVPPGHYFWAICVYQNNSLQSTVARGRVEVREGLA